MKNVRQLLDKKGSQVWSIQADATVFDALKQLDEKKIGALVVMEDDNPIAMLSERDYARKIILAGKSSQTAKVRDIMSSELVFVMPNNTLEECMAIMTAKRIRHLPVFEKDELIGMVTIGDVVKAIIADQQDLIGS
jgi:CBS domain-containing protein